MIASYDRKLLNSTYDAIKAYKINTVTNAISDISNSKIKDIENTKAIKEQSDKLQAELEELTAEGSSGGRMVTVTLNGKFELMGIKLDPICVDNRDVQMLEDLIVAAHKNAMENIQEKIKSKSSDILGGLDLSKFGL